MMQATEDWRGDQPDVSSCAIRLTILFGGTSLKNGKIVNLEVSPEVRRKDVTVMEPQ